MFKDFVMKKMMQSKLKDVPQADQEKIMKIMEKNPDLLMKIAEEVQIKIKGGMDEMSAAVEVMKMHEAELKGILSNS